MIRIHLKAMHLSIKGKKKKQLIMMMIRKVSIWRKFLNLMKMLILMMKRHINSSSYRKWKD